MKSQKMTLKEWVDYAIWNSGSLKTAIGRPPHNKHVLQQVTTKWLRPNKPATPSKDYQIALKEIAETIHNVDLQLPKPYRVKKS
jgi:hypothetical protein